MDSLHLDPGNVNVEADEQPVPTTVTGLRERSKAKRRELIRRTAMQLFADKGYEATTIADIAEAAEVAPRTIFGYFPSKVDLATSFADELAARLSATFADHPDGDVLTVLDVWLAGEVTVSDPGLASLARTMYEANPELRALSTAHVTEAAERGSAAIAAELQLQVGDPMVAICSAALGGALGSYLGAATRPDAHPGLHDSMMTFLRGLIAAAKPA